jgi:membrane protein required for beta-lactamase induction
MKESAKQIVPLDWVFFGVSIVMILEGVFRIAVGSRIGAWLIGIGAYAAYASIYVEKVGRRTGIVFIALGTFALIWAMFNAILLIGLGSAVEILVTVSGWLVFGTIYLPMGIHLIKRARSMKEAKRR